MHIRSSLSISRSAVTFLVTNGPWLSNIKVAAVCGWSAPTLGGVFLYVYPRPLVVIAKLFLWIRYHLTGHLYCCCCYSISSKCLARHALEIMSLKGVSPSSAGFHTQAPTHTHAHTHTHTHTHTHRKEDNYLLQCLWSTPLNSKLPLSTKLQKLVVERSITTDYAECFVVYLLKSEDVIDARGERRHCEFSNLNL